MKYEFVISCCKKGLWLIFVISPNTSSNCMVKEGKTNSFFSLFFTIILCSLPGTPGSWHVVLTVAPITSIFHHNVSLLISLGEIHPCTLHSGWVQGQTDNCTRVTCTVGEYRGQTEITVPFTVREYRGQTDIKEVITDPPHSPTVHYILYCIPGNSVSNEYYQ